MEKKEKSLVLNRAGVDEASNTVRQWLEEARISLLHMELALQAEHMGLLDHKVLRSKL